MGVKRIHVCVYVFLLTALFLFVWRADTVYGADIASGTYEGMSWRLTEEYELILGNGGTQTMTNNQNRWLTWPWYTRGYASQIKKVRTNGTIIVCGQMRSIFYGCNNVVEIDIDGFDSSQSTNVGNLFQVCESLEKVDVSGLNTSNSTDLGGLFAWCMKLENIDVSHFDTRKVTNLWDMFNNCRSVKHLDVGHFDTSRCGNFNHLFRDCYALESIDVSHWDTRNVTSMNEMFARCKTIQELDLSS